MAFRIKIIGFLIGLIAITSIGNATEIEKRRSSKLTEDLSAKLEATNALRQFRCDMASIDERQAGNFYNVTGSMINAMEMNKKTGVEMSAALQNNYRLAQEIHSLAKTVLMFKERRAWDFSDETDAQRYIAKTSLAGDACTSIKSLFLKLLEEAK